VQSSCRIQQTTPKHWTCRKINASEPVQNTYAFPIHKIFAFPSYLMGYNVLVLIFFIMERLAFSSQGWYDCYQPTERQNFSELEINKFLYSIQESLFKQYKIFQVRFDGSLFKICLQICTNMCPDLC
jgi:hypothetical protein